MTSVPTAKYSELRKDLEQVKETQSRLSEKLGKDSAPSVSPVKSQVGEVQRGNFMKRENSSKLLDQLYQ